MNTKLTDWKNEPTIEDFKEDLLYSKADNEVHVAEVSYWLDNLNVEGSAKKPPIQGKSSYQSKLIRKQAEWRYSSLSEPYLATKDVFTIKPKTYEDKLAATQNALVLNNQFNTKLNKIDFIDKYIRTAVNEGSVLCRIYWNNQEEEIEVTKDIYEIKEASTEEEIQALQVLMQQYQEDPNTFNNTSPEHVLKAVQLTVQSGVPYVPISIGTEVVSERNTLKNQPEISICDYRNFYIDPSCNGIFEDARFIIYGSETSLSELKMDSGNNYQNLDKIDIKSAPFDASFHYKSNKEGLNFKDDARKRIIMYEYFGYWDIDGNDTVKPIIASFVNDTIIRLELNPYPDGEFPYTLTQYLPRTDSLFGEPDGSLLEDNQNVVGATTRAIIDIMANTASGQKGIVKNMLDVINKSKYDQGRDYEFNQNIHPSNGIITHVAPEIPQSAPLMIQMMNQEAESLTGVKAFNSGIEGNSLGNSATGVRSTLEASSKRESAILRRLSKGLCDIARKIITFNAVWLDEVEVVRITNSEFINVKKDDLSGNFDLEIDISTIEEDNQRAQELAFVLQTIGNNVNPQLTQYILSEIAILRKMPVIAQKIVSFQPEPDPMEQQIQQLKLQKLQAEIRELNAKAMKAEFEAGVHGAKSANIQSDTDLKNLNFLEQESGATQARNLELHGKQAESNMALKILEANLNKDKK